MPFYTRRPMHIGFLRHAGGTAVMGIPLRSRLIALLLGLLVACFAATPPVAASPPAFPQVLQGVPLAFPRDYGAHPGFRTEWWYVTGWLETQDKKPLGFQITFFRSATDHDPSNPSRFAPRQLIIAHAALSDPAAGKLLHDQKSARETVSASPTPNRAIRMSNWMTGTCCAKRMGVIKPA